VNQREEIATHAAQMRTGHRDCRIGGDRRIDGVASGREDQVAGPGRQLVSGGNEMTCSPGRSLGKTIRPRVHRRDRTPTILLFPIDCRPNS